MATQSPTVVVAMAMVVVTSAFVFLIVHAMRGGTAASFAAQNKTNNSGSTLVASAQSTTTDQDSDGDELQDWEEVLWNTDPHNKDTDGDVISDGVEVGRGDSPTIVGSGHVADASQQSTSSTPLNNATQEVARNLMTSVMLGIKEKGGVKNVNQQQIIEQALKEAQKYLVVTPFTREDVTSVTSTQESRKAYLLSVGDMFSGMTATNEPEEDTLLRMAQGEKVKSLETLTKTTQSYAQYIEAFKHVPVPSDAVAVHVQLVNALLEYNNALSGIVYLNDDPVRAAASLNLYSTRNQQVGTALVSFKQYLDTNNLFPKTTATTTSPLSSVANTVPTNL
jgi:hypothetical protein